MGLVRSFIGTDGIWQYIPHINTGLFSIIKVHFLLFANLIVDWHINTINFTDSGIIKKSWQMTHCRITIFVKCGRYHTTSIFIKKIRVICSSSEKGHSKRRLRNDHLNSSLLFRCNIFIHKLRQTPANRIRRTWDFPIRTDIDTSASGRFSCDDIRTAVSYHIGFG